jgi:hypothetical protein
MPFLLEYGRRNQMMVSSCLQEVESCVPEPEGEVVAFVIYLERDG